MKVSEVKKFAPAQMETESENVGRRRGVKVKYFKTDEPNLYAVVYHEERAVFYNLDFAGKNRVYVYK